MNPKMKAGSQELYSFLGYFVLLPVILILLPVHFAFAQYHYELTPSISVGEVYDDNIYLEFTDPTSDYITEVSPGLNLNILSPKMQFEVEYIPTFVWYREIGLVCKEKMHRNIWRLGLVVWQVRF